MPEPEDWKAIPCGHCDFSGGARGMDRCARCDGTGSQLALLTTDERFPNSKTGWERLEARGAALKTSEPPGQPKQRPISEMDMD